MKNFEGNDHSVWWTSSFPLPPQRHIPCFWRHVHHLLLNQHVERLFTLQIFEKLNGSLTSTLVSLHSNLPSTHRSTFPWKWWHWWSSSFLRMYRRILDRNHLAYFVIESIGYVEHLYGRNFWAAESISKINFNSTPHPKVAQRVTTSQIIISSSNAQNTSSKICVEEFFRLRDPFLKFILN